VKRLLLSAVALAVLGGGIVAWQAISQEQAPIEAVQSDEQVTAPPAMSLGAAESEAASGNSSEAAPAPVVTEKIPDKPLTTEGTPMGERVAVLGLLNKRNGESRDLKMRPGQAIRVGDVVVRLRACETTAPWEDQQLTGAFTQVDVRGRDGAWRRVFSGWLYKESPSLNAVEHPVYDVWPKSCTMVHPDIGPETTRISGSVVRAPSDSSAKKSAGDQPAAPAPGTPPVVTPPPPPATTPPGPKPSAASNSAT
jgi:hypothetical protein